MNKITFDHSEITSWVEKQGGSPAHIPGTAKPGEIGMLRFKFNENTSKLIEVITWNKFLTVFDQKKLALLYDPNTRFFKFIRRK